MYNLKKIRLEKGFSQKSLCEELGKIGCGMDRTTYTRYETGSRELPCSVLIGLSVFYGVSTDYLLGLKNSE